MNFENLLHLLETGSHSYAYALAVTFLAGIAASAICPCTVPVGLGVASVAGATEAERRHSGLQIAVAFFAGIVASLTILGAAAGQIGALATEAFGRGWALAMALTSFGFALWAFFGPVVKFARVKTWKKPGVTGAFVYGLIFSVGTSVAPLLLLVTVAASTANVLGGITLAFVFGLGRGVPFLAAGLAGSIVARMAHLTRWSRGLQLLSGVMLLVVSVYYTQVFWALS